MLNIYISQIHPYELGYKTFKGSKRLRKKKYKKINTEKYIRLLSEISKSMSRHIESQILYGTKQIQPTHAKFGFTAPNFKHLPYTVA